MSNEQRVINGHERPANSEAVSAASDLTERLAPSSPCPEPAAAHAHAAFHQTVQPRYADLQV